jgi:predicted transposase YbfD/YdcC
LREKSNEKTAIPTLLQTLALEGCIVTIDAMGTQTNIAQGIRDKKADYVLAVKKNYPRLAEAMSNFFMQFQSAAPDKIPHSFQVRAPHAPANHCLLIGLALSFG